VPPSASEPDVDRDALAQAKSSFDGAPDQSGLETFGKTGQPEALPGKTPELNPDRLNTVDLGVVGRKTAVDGLNVKPDGRVFGPPVSPTAPLRNPSGKGYVRAYPVEQYPAPARFRTITKTKVLSSPSMTANTLTELKAGSNIQVVARMGIWLELRSTGGRKGYIYVQDAEMVPLPR
jgi:hypothetical protein